MTRAAAIALAAFLLLPVADAQSPAPGAHHDGSEAVPNIKDEAGDVEWAAVTDGSGHEYMDVLAAWISYVSTNDTVQVVMKVADNRPFRDPPADWIASCWLQADATVADTPDGLVRFEWRHNNGEGSGNASFVEEVRDGSTVYHGLEHVFGFTGSAPGYFTWEVSRSAILWGAESISDLRVYCFEMYEPVELLVGVQGGPNPLQSADYANGSLGFSFVSLVPPTDEESEPSLLANGDDGVAAAKTAKSPEGGLAVLCACLALIALARRRLLG